MSRNHPVYLTTLLAFGFGVALTSALSTRDAVGYPGGMAVSTGWNPVLSSGGMVEGTTSVDLFSAPSDQAVVITDVSLSLGDGGAECEGATTVWLYAGGAVIAAYSIGYVREGNGSYRTQGKPQLVQSMRAGLQVPPGVPLTLATNQLWTANCNGSALDVYYTVAGYYAQP
jgi:hypothetical protein